MSIRNKTAESSSSFDSSLSPKAANAPAAGPRRMTEFSEVVEALRPSAMRRRGILLTDPRLHLMAEQATKRDNLKQDHGNALEQSSYSSSCSSVEMFDYMDTQDNSIPQQELQFNRFMNYLLREQPYKLVKKDIFRKGMDCIVLKNPEEDIMFGIEALIKCQEKSSEIIPLYENRMKSKCEILQDKKFKERFSYRKVKSLNEKIEEIKKSTQSRIDDQLKLQKWLSLTIDQNMGVFQLHGKQFIFDKKSLYVFSY